FQTKRRKRREPAADSAHQKSARRCPSLEVCVRSGRREEPADQERAKNVDRQRSIRKARSEPPYRLHRQAKARGATQRAPEGNGQNAVQRHRLKRGLPCST